MTIKEIRTNLSQLFENWSGNSPEEMMELPISGSSRKYFRIVGSGKTVIGAFSDDSTENKAFFYLANHLKACGVNVPELYIRDEAKGVYLQQDLGNVNLYDQVIASGNKYQEELLSVYKKVIDQMPLLQYKAAEGLDYSVCYPREAFDRQSIQWDLNYFKYCFLKLVHIPFHEQKLEDEFQKLIDFVLDAPSDFFLFRDFQSRNIMLYNNKIYFIDFQGGRRGALQYDLASLLFESKTNLSDEFRNKLLEHYLNVFSKYDFFDKNVFLNFFPAFVLIRLLQAFGAYGYRGLSEKKSLFVKSIVPGLINLQWIINQAEISNRFPYLCSILEAMQTLKDKFIVLQDKKKLTITITSFSYKNGLPDDWSGNGGGFVFDCRALPNPGRYEKYRESTGRDEDVIQFFDKEEEVKSFLKKTQNLVSDSVRKYIERNFINLSVAFGCTGGQHRSVFAAEQLFEYLKMNFASNLRLVHREQKIEVFYNYVAGGSSGWQ